MENLESMKCINVKHYFNGGEENEVISFEQFKRSFVDERWTGERRTNKKATMFGYHHTKTTVKCPSDKRLISVRIFDFPSSRLEAENRDYGYKKAII